MSFTQALIIIFLLICVAPIKKSFLIQVLRNLRARRKLRHRIAIRIRTCFPKERLRAYSFVSDDKKLKTRSGCTRFFEATEIEPCIDKLNTLIGKLYDD